MPLFWFQTQLLTPSHSKEVLLCIKHNKYCGTERVIEVFWAKYHKRLCWPIILICNVRRRGACLPKRGQVPAHRTSCGSQMLRLCAKSNKTSPNSWCAFHVLVLMSPITSGERHTHLRGWWAWGLMLLEVKAPICQDIGSHIFLVFTVGSYFIYFSKTGSHSVT